MNIRSLDPFTRTGSLIASRFRLGDFDSKRFAKTWWTLFIVAMACAIRYWRYGDHLLALLIGTAAFLTYWRNWRFGAFRCCRCRHNKGPEDLGRIIRGEPDKADPLERARIWMVLGIFVASCLSSIWSTLVSGIIPVAAFAALGAIEYAFARHRVDHTAEKECCACVIKLAEIDGQLDRINQNLDSISKGAGLKKNDGSFPTVPPLVTHHPRTADEGECEIFIHH